MPSSHKDGDALLFRGTSAQFDGPGYIHPFVENREALVFDGVETGRSKSNCTDFASEMKPDSVDRTDNWSQNASSSDGYEHVIERVQPVDSQEDPVRMVDEREGGVRLKLVPRYHYVGS